MFSGVAPCTSRADVLLHVRHPGGERRFRRAPRGRLQPGGVRRLQTRDPRGVFRLEEHDGFDLLVVGGRPGLEIVGHDAFQVFRFRDGGFLFAGVGARVGGFLVAQRSRPRRIRCELIVCQCFHWVSSRIGCTSSGAPRRRLCKIRRLHVVEAAVRRAGKKLPAATMPLSPESAPAAGAG